MYFFNFERKCTFNPHIYVLSTDSDTSSGADDRQIELTSKHQ